MRGEQEKLTLLQFVYKNKSLFIILYRCRHPVRLQGPHLESDKEGVNPLQAVLQGVERLYLVGASP